MKSTFDLAVSFIALPFVLVICALCCIAIRVESKGNPIFSQMRVGKNQRHFILYKLRTMAFDTGDHASHKVSAAQITKVGNFLRKTKLDELPQLVNVFLGQMSFVGPRPCLPNQVELVNFRSEYGVYAIRPGITGPAQLQGVDMSTPQKLAKIDASYVKNYTFAKDLQYIMRTVLGGGSGDAVGK